MDHFNALLGKTITGGGIRRKYKKPVKKVVKKVVKKGIKKYRGGENEQNFNCKCTLETGGTEQPQYPATLSILAPADKLNDSVAVKLPDIVPPTQSGGKSLKESVYKKYLEGLTTERLHKIASSKGVKITKKKNDKTVYVKKATIIKKLIEYKYK